MSRAVSSVVGLSVAAALVASLAPSALAAPTRAADEPVILEDGLTTGVPAVSDAPAVSGPVAAAGSARVVSADDGVTDLALPLTGARAPESIVAELPATATGTFSMVGVTWTGDADYDLHAEVSVRQDGEWSEWALLGHADGDASDSQTGTVGTAPLWADDADGVAVRVESHEGGVPDDLQVSLVTTMPRPTDGPVAAAAAAALRKPPSDNFPDRPGIVTRKQWGADPSLGGSCDSPIYGSQVKAVVVHHTVNSNDYSRSESAELVRGIQRYHTVSNGWCDVGYNFLVDRYGTVYEGRRGGLDKPVRGAHAGDVNTDTAGISMIGNYDVAPVPNATKRAMVRLVAWRLGTSYTPALGSLQLAGYRMSRIAGHRDVMSTACPGIYAYRWLPTLRAKVAKRLEAFDSRIRQRRAKVGFGRTGSVFVGETRVAGGRRTDFSEMTMYTRPGVRVTKVPPGPVLKVYKGMGGPTGKLGFPVRDLKPTDSRPRVRILRAQRGRIIREPGRMAIAVSGPIDRAYRKVGGVEGRLGVPKSRVKRSARGAVQMFAGGRIGYDRARKKTVITYRTKP